MYRQSKRNLSIFLPRCLMAGTKTVPALQGIYRKLLDIDLESKNSTTPWEVALDTFVVEIAG
jgi:hypothetical protein